jgi:hypothetical protein
VSKEPPAHARRERPGGNGAGDRGDDGDGDRDDAPGSTLPPAPPATVAAALRGLAPPRHDSAFWTDLDARLADEPQLRLAPRAAIRPITQPPPVIDDGNLATSLKGDPQPPRRSSRRPLITGVAALLVALLVVAALQQPDDSSDGDDAATSPETSEGRAPDSDDAGGTTTTAAPTTTAPPGTVAPNEHMVAGGVGPLRIGARMADLQAAGLNIQPDAQTFEVSGGSCYIARVAGALDLELRFRAPEGQFGVDDPTQGELAAISIKAGLPTGRTVNSGLGLGAPQDQVLAAYAGRLDDRAHPFVAGGHIFRVDAGNGRGMAFQTDGQVVIGIAVGDMDAIRFVNECG